MRQFAFILIPFTFLALYSCNNSNNSYVPKPRGYHRIELPPHEYNKLDEEDFPYNFDYSKYAIVRPDSSDFAQPYWIEVIYPKFSATVSISYKSINGSEDSLAAFVNTSSRLTHEHGARATAIMEYPVKTPLGYGGIISELEGETPSFFQFWLTDSTQHFLRGALYFPTANRADSLAPVIEYVKVDLMEMINSVELAE